MSREEDLKKINDELEMLSDEELEKVSGGCIGDVAMDSRILYQYGMLPKGYYGDEVARNWEKCSKEVVAGWKKVGITCVPIYGDDNQYFLKGKKISNMDAIDFLEKNFKQIHK